MRKEKTIMFAILIQLFIASFSSVILLGIMVYYDPGSIGQNRQVGTQCGRARESQQQVHPVTCRTATTTFCFTMIPTSAEAAFKSGRLDAIVIFPMRIKAW